MGTPYEKHGSVAVITLNNPPLNGLSHELRTAIVHGIDSAAVDDSVTAIVLIGNERAFSSGADIREFGTPKATFEPTLLSVIDVVEQSSKPVIAAIGGACMGGGLELALGCHYRVALGDAQIALPEVKLGILPGAGGTQRMPRAVGVETALNMIVSGQIVPAQLLGRAAIFDRIVAGNLLESALAFAREVVDAKMPLKRLRDVELKFMNPDAFFQFARNTVGAVAKNLPAPLKCVDAVEAAVKRPFAEGMKFEREAFTHLVSTDESRALRHAFFGERAASKIPDMPEGVKPRSIAKVGIIGAGTMGGGIAMNFINVGIPVVLLEVKQESLDAGLDKIRKNYGGAVAKGRMKADEVDTRVGLITSTLNYESLSDVDLVIEAVFEDMGIKERVFTKLDEVCKPGAILASNTSTLDMNIIASFTKRPEDVVGLHFFSPANVMKLLEVVRAEKTSFEVLATVMGLAKTIKKTAVVSGVCDGFIGNRMLNPYLRQALSLVEEGALPWQVDSVLESFGMAMGPFRMSDLAGNDIGWAIRKRRYRELEAQGVPADKLRSVADKICEEGRFGQKTGSGWYKYEPGRRDAIRDPRAQEIIEQYQRDNGIATRTFSDQEILERCIFALINEGARILEEGIAQRASDIDMVYLTGYGFPVFRGGPMLYADTVGLFTLVRTMARFRRETGDEFWQPAALLSRLASEGKSLAS